MSTVTLPKFRTPKKKHHFLLIRLITATATHQFQPNLAHDDVVHATVDVLPRIHLVVPARNHSNIHTSNHLRFSTRLTLYKKRQRGVPKQMQAHDALGSDLDRFAPELEFGVDGAMKVEDWRVGVERTDGRVMTHLLCDDLEAKVGPVEFVRLTQQRIERLAHSLPIGRGCRCSKSCHVLHTRQKT